MDFSIEESAEVVISAIVCSIVFALCYSNVTSLFQLVTNCILHWCQYGI